MTFIELANKVLMEAESHNTLGQIESIPVGQEAPEAHRRAVEWVKEAYEEIQRRNDWWKFHHQTGTFLTTSGTTSDYTVADVRRADPDAFQCKEQGESYSWPLIWVPYERWVEMFKVPWEQLSAGHPLYITRLPDDDWRLTPKPDGTKTFEVNADWQRTNHQLETSMNEPLWSNEFHQLIVWVALESYAEEYDVAPLQARLRTKLARLWAAFNRRYLPEFQE